MSFEFVRAIGTELLPITLQPNQELGGKVLKHVMGNGPIYVRALADIHIPQKVSFIFFPFIKDYLRKDHRFSIMQGKILVMGMHTNIYQFQLCFSFNFVIEPHITFF